MKTPSVKQIKSDPTFPIFIGTYKKLLWELLGWSESRSVAYVEKSLRRPEVRLFFYHDTPCYVVARLVTWETLGNRIVGLPLIRLEARIWHELEGSRKTYNTSPDRDPNYDWVAAKRRVRRLLREAEQIARNSV